MQSVATPHVNRLGHIFYKEGMRYMCGMKLSTDKDYPKSPEYTAYWSTNPSEAISVFDLCKVWESVAPVYDSCPVNTEILIGCTSHLETCRPYRLNAVGATLFLTYQGLSHQEAGWDEVTPEWLYDWATPAKPVLKRRPIDEWAFKLGTLCSVGTPTPDWKTVIKRGMFAHDNICSSILPELEQLFTLGTHCKVDADSTWLHKHYYGSIPVKRAVSHASTTAMPTNNNCIGMIPSETPPRGIGDWL